MRDSNGALPAGLQVARSWAVLQRAGALPWTPREDAPGGPHTASRCAEMHSESECERNSDDAGDKRKLKSASTEHGAGSPGKQKVELELLEFKASSSHVSTVRSREGDRQRRGGPGDADRRAHSPAAQQPRAPTVPPESGQEPRGTRRRGGRADGRRAPHAAPRLAGRRAPSPHTCRVAVPRGRAHAVPVGCGARAAAPEDWPAGSWVSARSTVPCGRGSCRAWERACRPCLQTLPTSETGLCAQGPLGRTGLDGLHCLRPGRTCRRSGPWVSAPYQALWSNLEGFFAPGVPHPSEGPSRCALSPPPWLVSWARLLLGRCPGLESGPAGTAPPGSLCVWDASGGPSTPGAISRPRH